jgi:hypothetical protein
MSCTASVGIEPDNQARGAERSNLVGLCEGDMLNLKDLPVLKWPLQVDFRKRTEMGQDSRVTCRGEKMMAPQ